jgi:hypothetical protein
MPVDECGVTLDGVQRILRSAYCSRFRRALSFSVDSSGLGESWLSLHTYLPFSNGFGFKQDVEQSDNTLVSRDRIKAMPMKCMCVCVFV